MFSKLLNKQPDQDMDDVAVSVVISHEIVSKLILLNIQYSHIFNTKLQTSKLSTENERFIETKLHQRKQRRE